MGLQCGIVGLPNVGKSTLFNALTETAAAEAANYPFCTIEPNVGRVSVPDMRLTKLSEMAKSEKVIHTQIEFVDIAGLVRGASKGEGLGNQFLSHIREVNAIVHVLRCFIDENVTHVEDSVDPLRDADIVDLELILADMESLEKRLPNLQKKAKGGDKEAKEQIPVVEKVLKTLKDDVKPARAADLSDDERKILKHLQLITSKPVLYVCNVEEASAAEGNDLSKKVFEKAKAENAEAVVVSAAIEAELCALEDEADKKDFLETLGLQEPGLHRVIRGAYKLLNLLSFFTVGPKEARAWTTRFGAKAPEAAGEIHTDFERGFICAETASYDDYVDCGGEQACKDAGKLRLEGKDYVVKDGDVFHFRFNV